MAAQLKRIVDKQVICILVKSRKLDSKFPKFSACNLRFNMGFLLSAGNAINFTDY